VILTSDVVSFKENLTKNLLPAVGIAYRPSGFYESYEWIAVFRPGRTRR